MNRRWVGLGLHSYAIGTWEYTLPHVRWHEPQTEVRKMWLFPLKKPENASIKFVIQAAQATLLSTKGKTARATKFTWLHHWLVSITAKVVCSCIILVDLLEMPRQKLLRKSGHRHQWPACFLQWQAHSSPQSNWNSSRDAEGEDEREGKGRDNSHSTHLSWSGPAFTESNVRGCLSSPVLLKT